MYVFSSLTYLVRLTFLHIMELRTIYFKMTEKPAFKSNLGNSEIHFFKKKVQLMLHGAMIKYTGNTPKIHVDLKCTRIPRGRNVCNTHGNLYCCSTWNPRGYLGGIYV